MDSRSAGVPLRARNAPSNSFPLTLSCPGHVLVVLRTDPFPKFPCMSTMSRERPRLIPAGTLAVDKEILLRS
jgi:hypothetical protein